MINANNCFVTALLQLQLIYSFFNASLTALRIFQAKILLQWDFAIEQLKSQPTLLFLFLHVNSISPPPPTNTFDFKVCNLSFALSQWKFRPLNFSY